MSGLKPVYGGSSPPFLVNGVLELEQRRALQMCGRGAGSHGVTQHLLL